MQRKRKRPAPLAAPAVGQRLLADLLPGGPAKKRAKSEEAGGGCGLLGSMDTSRRRETTYGGYRFDVMKSGLQKYVRRGETKKALFCAIEMALFLAAPSGARLVTNFYNRLRIIALEDVSLAGANTIMETADRLASLERARERRKKDEASSPPPPTPAEKAAVVDIVWLLSSSKHARLPSHYRAAFCRPDVAPKLESACPEVGAQLRTAGNRDACPLPSLAYPLTAAEGANGALESAVCRLVYCLERRWGAGFAPLHDLLEIGKGPGLHFRSHNTAFLALDVFVWFVGRHPERFPLGPATRSLLRLLGVQLTWCKDMINNREGLPLCVRTAYLALVLYDEVDWSEVPRLPPDTVSPADLFDANLGRSGTLQMDAYVMDMHTREGRKAGRNGHDFAVEGSLVANEDERLVNPLYKRLYLCSKGVGSEEDDGHDAAADAHESATFEPLVRAQLVTSRSKQDTYFALMKRAVPPFAKGQRVFVKGPFDRGGAVADGARLAALFNSLKRHLAGLNHQGMLALDLVADVRLDPFSQPLGLRTGIPTRDRVTPRPFLVCADLTTARSGAEEKKSLPIRLHRSKIWPSTPVVDFDTLARKEILCVGRPSTLPPAGLDQLILAICFRHVFQIPDCAARNFLWCPPTGRLHSVDEDATTLARHSKGLGGDKLLPKAGKGRALIRKRLEDPAVLEKIRGHLDAWWRALSDEESEAHRLLAQLPAGTIALENLRALSKDPTALFTIEPACQ